MKNQFRQMKKFFCSVTLLMIFLVACEPREDSEIMEVAPNEVVVNLGIGGEMINFSDEAIGGRTESEGERTYFFIDVDRITPSSEQYARAILDHIPDSLPLTLLEGSTYEITGWAFRRGESFGIASSSDSTIDVQVSDLVIKNRFELNESIDPTNFLYYVDEDSSITASGSLFDATPINVFYGTASVDTSEPLPGDVTLDLVRNVFGIDVFQENLSPTQMITVSTSGVSLALTSVDSSKSAIRSIQLVQFFDIPSPTDFSGFLSINLRDTLSGIVVNESLFSESITLNRLQRKQIFISAPQDSTSSGSGGFSITIEDQPLIVGDSLFIGG